MSPESGLEGRGFDSKDPYCNHYIYHVSPRGQKGRNLGGNSVWGVIVVGKEKKKQEPRREKEKQEKVERCWRKPFSTYNYDKD